VLAGAVAEAGALAEAGVLVEAGALADAGVLGAVLVGALALVVCAIAGSINAAKAALNKVILVGFVIVIDFSFFRSFHRFILDSAAGKIKNPDFRR
jgi:hypothetical protein